MSALILMLSKSKPHGGVSCYRGFIVNRRAGKGRASLNDLEVARKRWDYPGVIGGHLTWFWTSTNSRENLFS